MKHIIYCVLFLFLPLFSSECLAGNDEDYWLERLDKSLDQRDVFEQKKLSRIDKLRRQLDIADSTTQGYELAYSLYNEYKSYCYDSARH